MGTAAGRGGPGGARIRCGDGGEWGDGGFEGSAVCVRSVLHSLVVLQSPYDMIMTVLASVGPVIRYGRDSRQRQVANLATAPRTRLKCCETPPFPPPR